MWEVYVNINNINKEFCKRFYDKKKKDDFIRKLKYSKKLTLVDVLDWSWFYD